MPSPEYGDHSSSELAALLTFVRSTGKPVLAGSGKVLFREGDPCEGAYFVESGELELTIASGSKKFTLGVACLGQLLAIAPVIRESEYPFTATAITDCSVRFIEAGQMRSYLRQHPESCLHTVQMLGSEILDLSSNMIRPLRLQPRYPKN
jgi:CRP-like cAMP-binding protein